MDNYEWGELKSILSAEAFFRWSRTLFSFHVLKWSLVQSPALFKSCFHFIFRRLYFRPVDADLDEFHPKATRTLYIGNLAREVSANDLHEKFSGFGEILEIDVKKCGYATVQFVDIVSVCKAIKACDGGSVGNSTRLKLAFAKASPTKCVWCEGLSDSVKEKDILAEFGRYGKIQDIIIHRPKGQALIWFDQVRSRFQPQLFFSTSECFSSLELLLRTTCSLNVVSLVAALGLAYFLCWGLSEIESNEIG